jgi:hypothetical protein
VGLGIAVDGEGASDGDDGGGVDEGTVVADGLGRAGAQAVMNMAIATMTPRTFTAVSQDSIRVSSRPIRRSTTVACGSRPFDVAEAHSDVWRA